MPLPKPPHAMKPRRTLSTLSLAVAALAASAGPATAQELSWSGFGTPISTSTFMSSLDLPSAVATVSELCHSASRSARTAALV